MIEERDDIFENQTDISFVNAIFVYNDRLLFTFNYKRDAKTVLFSDLKSSDITKGVRPKIRKNA